MSSARRSQMLLCSCFCLFLESSFPLLHMSKFYLYFKMQLKCHFFHIFFPDTPDIPRGCDLDKLKPLVRKESRSMYLSATATVSHTEQVFSEHGLN